MIYSSSLRHIIFRDFRRFIERRTGRSKYRYKKTYSTNKILPAKYNVRGENVLLRENVPTRVRHRNSRYILYMYFLTFLGVAASVSTASPYEFSLLLEFEFLF